MGVWEYGGMGVKTVIGQPSSVIVMGFLRSALGVKRSAFSAFASVRRKKAVGRC